MGLVVSGFSGVVGVVGLVVGGFSGVVGIVGLVVGGFSGVVGVVGFVAKYSAGGFIYFSDIICPVLNFFLVKLSTS